MNIPNDTGHPWRLDKFTEYQYKARAVDIPFLSEYAKSKNLNNDEKILLCWYHSLTYCEITALFMLNTIDYKTITNSEIESYWKEHKDKLLFGSARKYTKLMNWFVPLMTTFFNNCNKRPYEWLTQIAGQGDEETKYNRIFKVLSSWKFMGRFSVDLFLQLLSELGEKNLVDTKVKTFEIDWTNGSNLTSGILNIFYSDEEADNFDKTGVLSAELKKLVSDGAKEIYNAVLNKYPKQETKDFSLIMSKVCSFRNLFKKSRYGGFHHDRQLEYINVFKNNYPNFIYLWEESLQIRKKLFFKEMLGELQGWEGIRKERKKLWVERGLTGVETEKEDIQETTRSSIVNSQNSEVLIVDPYSYKNKKTVDKTFPKQIQKLSDKNKIKLCYFPIEPFHYREVKRHATQLAVDACIKNEIPVSFETRQSIPDWAIRALSKNKYSEVRINLNTLNEKNWKIMYPAAASVKELLSNFDRCFENGVEAILKLSPILPPMSEPDDIFSLVDRLKHKIKYVEILFASFDEDEKVKSIIGQDNFEKFYEEVKGRWYVKEKYRLDFLKTLKMFTDGQKLILIPLTESLSKNSDWVRLKF